MLTHMKWCRHEPRREEEPVKPDRDSHPIEYVCLQLTEYVCLQLTEYVCMFTVNTVCMFIVNPVCLFTVNPGIIRGMEVINMV